MEMFYDDIDNDIEGIEFSPIDKAIANQCIAIPVIKSQ